MSRTRNSWKPLLHAYSRIRPTIEVSKPPAATPHSWKGLPMSNATTFVGLDVHARSVKVYAFVPATGEVERKSLGYEPGELASWMKSLPQPAKCVYESGVTGFHLCREPEVDGRRPRRRRRVQDAQARRRPRPQDRQARRAVPRRAARAGCASPSRFSAAVPNAELMVDGYTTQTRASTWSGSRRRCPTRTIPTTRHTWTR